MSAKNSTVAKGPPARDISLARQVTPYLSDMDVMSIGSIIVNADSSEYLDNPDGASIVDNVLSRHGTSAATVNMDKLFVLSPHAYRGVVSILRNRYAELNRPGPDTVPGSDSD